RFQRQGIRLGLLLGGVGIDGETLGFENGKWTAPGILQEVIGTAVGGSFLRGDLRFVGDAPTCLLKQPVNQHAGISFCAHVLHPCLFRHPSPAGHRHLCNPRICALSLHDALPISLSASGHTPWPAPWRSRDRRRNAWLRERQVDGSGYPSRGNRHGRRRQLPPWRPALCW